MYVPSHRIRLMAREDRFGRGSDQSSFTQNGFPAIVFREANENFGGSTASTTRSTAWTSATSRRTRA